MDGVRVVDLVENWVERMEKCLVDGWVVLMAEMMVFYWVVLLVA